MEPRTFVEDSLAFVALGPGLAAGAIGGAMLLGRPLSERATGRLVVWGSSVALLLTAGLIVAWTALGGVPIPVHFGRWFHVGAYDFEVSALVDGLSLTMLAVTGIIITLVARFSVRYLHREGGYQRYFLLLCLFTIGMHVLVMAGSFDLLFMGWEVVGMSSLLLISFFRHRTGPVRGVLRAMVSYRVADVGLLVAGVFLHEFAGSAEFSAAFGLDPWPTATAHLTHGSATVVVLALLLSVMGKSAQLPLSGWLPRAMEGPTPSSALFYGSLSVHAGVYLLLRAAPLLDASPVGAVAVGVVGGTTAVYATVVGRTQPDAKSALAFATIAQVGLMLVSIGMGFYRFALFHMVTHASLRVLQLLRTPSALRDAQEIRAALAKAPYARPSLVARLLPAPTLARFYHLALHRFFLDELLHRFVVRPFLGASQGLDRLERRWTAVLSGWGAPAASAADAQPRTSLPQDSLPQESVTVKRGGA
jgi:NADH:ubiquinone oxidoreductase subunit 5 (subunit L)/multisubunit Na+/H+ antiporter MnhA subunit